MSFSLGKLWNIQVLLIGILASYGVVTTFVSYDLAGRIQVIQSTKEQSIVAVIIVDGSKRPGNDLNKSFIIQLETNITALEALRRVTGNSVEGNQFSQYGFYITSILNISEDEGWAWTYYHWEGNSWMYANVGASAMRLTHDTVLKFVLATL